MQIGTRVQADLLFLDILGIIGEEARIRVGLIGRVADDPIVVGHISPHGIVHLVVDHLGFPPLFQLDNHDIVPVLRIAPDQDEIHPFGRLGDIVLDGNLHLIVDLAVIHDIPHELHRIVPRIELPLLPGIQSLRPDKRKDLPGNIAAPHVLNELPLIIVIYNHWLSQPKDNENRRISFMNYD